MYRHSVLKIIKALSIAFVFTSISTTSPADPLIVDHNCTDVTKIPQTAIEQAKSELHIAYGHTSHGSQLTTGMTGLVEFANNGGLGLTLSDNIIQWNNGGSEGALDLHDYFQAGDLGNPDRTNWRANIQR